MPTDRAVTSPPGAGDLVDVARRGDLSDRAFRVYALTSATFDGHEFTVGQAAQATSLTEQQVAQALTELRNAGIYTHRKRIVAYNGAKRIVRSLYRKVGESAVAQADADQDVRQRR